MKKLKLAEVKGFASLIVLGGMLLVAVALPIATKLVQQNQENRSSAASSCTSANVGKKYCSGSSILECKCTNTSYGTCVSWGWKTAVSCGTKGCASGSTSCYECSNDSHCSGSKKCVNHKCVSKVDGKCGTADGNTYSSKPTTNLCSKGSTTWLDENGYGGYYDWRCNGSNGGSSVKCSAKKKANSPVNGKCGSANGGTFDSKPTSGICSSGSSDWTDDKGSDGTWNWKCKGSNNGTDASCSAKKPSSVVDVTGITLNRTSVAVLVGSYADITATVLPANATNKNVAWSTSNSSVATVSVGGRITGVKVGTTKITAKTSNGKTATVDVTVKAAVVDTCKAAGGVCRTVCGNGEKIDTAHRDICSPAICCVPTTTLAVPGQCNDNYNGKVLTAPPSDSQACSVGGVYWVDRTASSGNYKWKCQGINGGKDAECSSKTSCAGANGSCVGSASICTGNMFGSVLNQSGCSGSTPVCCKVGGTTEGSVYNPNSELCAKKAGICATFGSALKTGNTCKVAGYSGTGSVVTGLCGGTTATVCCSGLIPQDSQCKDKKGVCQKVTTKCSGNYVTGLCPKSGSDIKCCVPGSPEHPVDPNPPTNDDKPATKITLNPTTLPLAVGASGMINATLEPTNSTDSITWTSADPAKATVTNGLVTGVAAGNVVITAKTDSGKTATASAVITAGVIPATAISLSPASTSLSIGETKVIAVTLTPSTSNDSVTWSTSDATKVTVSNGVIKGVAAGAATITARTGSGKTATVSVTVTTSNTNDSKISFRFALTGIWPKYVDPSDNSKYDCLDELNKKVKVDVVNSPTNVNQLAIETSFAPVIINGVGLTNSFGDQVFEVKDLVLDKAKFSSVNAANYVKVKGPFHLKRRFCADGQKNKISEVTVCNIPLNSGKVYDFSEYELLTGDVDSNGVINTLDFREVKKNLDAGAEISCGREYDLNMDGVVNTYDTKAVKDALASKDDE